MFLYRYDYQRRRSSFRPVLYVGCGAALLGLCAAVTAVALIVLPNPQAFALQMAGFRSAGSTDSLFNLQPARPTPQLADPQPVSQLVVSVPQVGERVVSLEGSVIQAETSADPATARTLLRATTDEAGLLALCQQFSNLCTTGTEQVRGMRFDLRPNGVIVFAEVLVPGLNTWQPVGVVFQQVGPRVGVVGVDVHGTLLVNPPAPFDALVQQADTLMNTVLASLSASVDGKTYALEDILMDETTVTLILRS